MNRKNQLKIHEHVNFLVIGTEIQTAKYHFNELYIEYLKYLNLAQFSCIAMLIESMPNGLGKNW